MIEVINRFEESFILVAIKRAIQNETEKLMEEWKKDLEKRTPEIVAGVIVDLMAISKFETLKDRFVFTIRKP